MKRIHPADRILLALMLLALLLVVACSNNPPQQDASAEVQWEKIGRFTYAARFDLEGVECVVVSGPDGRGGLDCDWPDR